MLISEIFGPTLQGEGLYTGKNTMFVRFFFCNLQCNGFGQEHPTKPETYELPHKSFDLSNIKKLTDIPVIDKGCDTSYSWSKKYKYLIEDISSSYVINKLKELMPQTGGKFVQNMQGKFISDVHLCFTGGEPLIKVNQKHIINIIDELYNQNNLPNHITFETNATQDLIPEFIEMISKYNETEFHVSCSPKLFSVTGETADKAWNHNAVSIYNDVFDKLSLKFVLNDDENSWRELNLYLSELSFYNSNIYIMPVGSTIEDQLSPQITRICNKALSNGFNISARLHTYIFGNEIGT
jgi:6-pyruvoyltetrahydropterin 2'-reductase